jgi:hypothetical protein
MKLLSGFKERAPIFLEPAWRSPAAERPQRIRHLHTVVGVGGDNRQTAQGTVKS